MMATLVDAGQAVQVQAVAVALSLGWWAVAAIPALFLALAVVAAFTSPRRLARHSTRRRHARY